MIPPITFADPNIALAAAAFGVLLVAAEFCFPGAVIPAAVGGALLLVALWSLGQQPLRLSAAAGAVAAIGLIAAAGWFAPPEWRWWITAAAAALLAASLTYITADIRWQLALAIATVLTPLTVRLLSLAALAHRNKAVIELP